MKISIIVPVYNEFRTLGDVLDRVRRAALPPGCEKEIIVVDDGSTDGTARFLQSQTQTNIVVVHHSPANYGKGAAIRIGITLASGDVILIQDGDLEYNPNDYGTILEPILQGRADVVYGSRFLGSCSGMALKNRIANWILTFTANLLYDAKLTDEATAYKAFRTSLLRGLEFGVPALRVLSGSDGKITAARLQDPRGADPVQRPGNCCRQKDPRARRFCSPVDAAQIPGDADCGWKAGSRCRGSSPKAARF